MIVGVSGGVNGLQRGALGAEQLTVLDPLVFKRFGFCVHLAVGIVNGKQ